MVDIKKEDPIPEKAEVGAVGALDKLVVYIQNEVLDYRGVELSSLAHMCRTDGQAKGILNSIKFPIKMARPTIKAADGGEAEAEFVKKNLLEEGGMETSLKTVIGTMALAVRDGYKIFEKVWELDQETKKIKLVKLAYRSCISTKFLYDGHGNIKGARQLATVDGEYKQIDFDKNKIAYFIYGAEENPYCGESDFYPVFYHYDKKHKLYAIAHLAYQLTAMPTRVGKHPTSLKGDDLKAFRESLDKLGTSTVLTMPNTCELDAFESKRGLTEFLYLIRHHDGMMSRAFLTQFMNLGQEGSGGGGTVSEDQSNLFLMALISLLDDIAKVFNQQVIPQLIDWNFGTKKYPKLVFSPFSDSIRSVIIELYKSLLTSRFPQVTPEFVLELEKSVAGELGLDLDYKAIEARIAEERKQMEEAADDTSDLDPAVGTDPNAIDQNTTHPATGGSQVNSLNKKKTTTKKKVIPK